MSDERQWEVLVHIEWPFIPGGLVCAIHPMLGTDCVNPSSFLSRFPIDRGNEYLCGQDR